MSQDQHLTSDNENDEENSTLFQHEVKVKKSRKENSFKKIIIYLLGILILLGVCSALGYVFFTLFGNKASPEKSVAKIIKQEGIETTDTSSKT